MWQQRIKAWLDAVRARFARRGERTTHGDIEAYESRHEAGVIGAPRGFDLRRSALPLTIGAIAVLSAVALVLHPPVQGVGRGEIGALGVGETLVGGDPGLVEAVGIGDVQLGLHPASSSERARRSAVSISAGTADASCAPT